MRIGLLAAMLSTGAYIASLHQDFMNGFMPHWSDTLAIPLGLTPLVLGIVGGWALLNFLFLWRPSLGPNHLYKISLRDNKFVVLEIFFTFFFILYFIVIGEFLFLIPTIFWEKFYLSLAAWRRRPHEPATC